MTLDEIADCLPALPCLEFCRRRVQPLQLVPDRIRDLVVKGKFGAHDNYMTSACVSE